MRKIFYPLLLITGFANAQIVNIPDANFKNKLIQLGVDTNSDGNIQTTEAQAVTILDLSNSSISDLTGISSFTNINSLFCNNNLISSINLIDFPLNQLSNLHIENNLLTQLDLTNMNNLDNIHCQNNQLTSIIINGSSYLDDVWCNNNNITSITILQNVFNFDCSNNELTSLNLSNHNFGTVNCEYNLITNLNLANTSISNLINCSYNNLTTVDASTANINNLDFSFNPAITSLNLKNGVNEQVSLYTFNDNVYPSLTFICADNFQLTNGSLNNFSFTNGSGLLLFPNLTINTYCSFTPGGNYNTITGQVLFDTSNNGCDASDLPQSNIRLDMTQWGVNSATFTNSNGNYNFYTTFADQMITPNIENSAYFTVTPPDAVVSFPQTNFLTVTQNFCISANGIHPDLEIVIAPITPARPGFDAVYQIVYKNKGNQTLSQLYGVNFFFNQNLMNFVSATTAPATIGSGSLSWSYANLLPFESRSIYVTLNVNTPTDVNYPVNIGDVLQFTTSILPIAGDETTTDNTFLYNQTVVGSYDPNDIICIEGTSVAPSLIGEYLHYVINFENTGTAEAENVVVKATIDITKFNLNSLQLLNTSHPSYVKITGNIVEFIFENIALDTGGHGNILLKIRSNGTLQSGDNVSNRGDIFFDYNAPIDTGIENTVFQSLNNSFFEKDNSVVIFPNPTQSVINLKSENSIKSIQLYDVQGRLLQTKLTDETSTSIDISDKSNGIYFLKITSEKGIKVERIVKE